MPRYINADLIEYEPMCRAKGNGMYEDCEIAHKDQIDDIPTADVIEVVRCRECKFLHFDENDDIWKCPWTIPSGADGYCSFGERADT